MLTCPNPTCQKKLPNLERECPRCRTDLSLLVDYVSNLQEGLAQAETLTRAGELGEAVWAYLSVLEVDPDNATARGQVGQVATAVRQFDQTPGRRWGSRIRRKARFRQWFHGDGSWAGTTAYILLVLGALIAGYALGYNAGQAPTTPPGEKEPANATP